MANKRVCLILPERWFGDDKVWEQHGAVMDKAIACTAGILEECWFMSWLLHFLSRCLLTVREKQQKMAQVSGPQPPSQEPWVAAPASWLQPGPELTVVTFGGINQHMENLYLILSLPCSASPINKSF